MSKDKATDKNAEYKKAMKDSIARAEQMRKKQEASRPKEEDMLPEVDSAVPEGYETLSSVFGIKLEEGERDIPVRVFSEEDWPDHLRSFIPKPIKGYIYEKESLVLFALGIHCNDRTLIHGEAGTGKSSIARQFCALTNMPFMRVNCREDMESSALFGSIHVENGTFGWLPGPAEELGRNGGVLQVDELACAPPGMNMSMQWMLERDGKIWLADKPGRPSDKLVTPDSWFRIVATDNTRLQGDISGAYAGTQVQNFAMLDRFNNVIEMDYPDPSREQAMLLGQVEGMTAELARRLVTVAGHVRAGFKEGVIQYALSPRTVLEWGQKAIVLGSITMAFKHVYWLKLEEDDRRQVEGYYKRVFKDASF